VLGVKLLISNDLGPKVYDCRPQLAGIVHVSSVLTAGSALSR